MPTNTYVALQTQTLGTATASVTFSSIPQGYTDLVLIINGTTASDGSYRFQFNGDTASNYSGTLLYGNGTSAISVRGSNENTTGGGRSGTTNSTSLIQFMNYSNINTFKTVISRGNNTAAIITATVGLWRNTSAITSIAVTSEGGNIQAGSTFTIYGIAAASVGAKATGGIISSDVNFFYHTFISNGTFTPTQSLSCDYLVVAGGAGGGGANSGEAGNAGGGAGGYTSATGFGVTATPYTVIIGGGGAGGTAGRGTIGVSSVLGAISTTGGGGGGSSAAGNQTGGNGGSGGGSTFGQTAGTGVSGEGLAGGVGLNSGSYRSGGGGGKAAAGGNGSSGGAGGAGLAWLDGNYYSGGGSAGTYGSVSLNPGGIGGGGASPASGNGEAGTTNTGGGGGGGSNSVGTTRTGGNGGSGIVIVRYAK